MAIEIRCVCRTWLRLRLGAMFVECECGAIWTAGGRRIDQLAMMGHGFAPEPPAEDERILRRLAAERGSR